MSDVLDYSKMVNFDFVEIGTADFETMAQKYPDQRGLSVEPIKMYLNRLPNVPNITKINCALVTEQEYMVSPEIDVYYIKEDVIREKNLGDWMKGCNSVGRPHDFHIGYYHDAGVWHDTPDRSKLATVNLLEMGLVAVEKVPCTTWKQLMYVHRIGQIYILKTDTEGMDAYLLQDILEFYWNSGRMGDLPRFIHFEDNAHTPIDAMDITKQLLRDAGYNVDDSHRYGHDSYATLIRG